MRIIGGSHKRRIIHAPESLPVRPTTDIAKEALFNVLNNHFDFEGLNVLDLFAGTGNISYEFASRGAAEVVAVDQHPRCVSFINETRLMLSLDNLKVIRSDVFRFLGYARQGFDVIFADPPYDIQGFEQIPRVVFERQLLAPKGWLIVEHPAEISFEDHEHFLEKRKYGKVNMSFFG
ncbi:MAG: 16S rRNA (guanine(966)-N(2))-methyltransferase RsmD [Bacteroidales bacterium]